MKDTSLKLPSLEKSLLSSRITSLEDYTQWEKTKKRAYHAQLDQQIWERRRRQELKRQQKSIQRANMSTMVEQQKNKQILNKYAKIKTQQKYQQDNYRLMGKDKDRKRSRQWYNQQKQHPFVKLVQEQDRRKQSTKNSFIYQNKLNELQNEMKKSKKLTEKRLAAAESQKYVDFVEEEFQKHFKERKKFEEKYLKQDKGSSQSFKKEYLQYLKGQAEQSRSCRNRLKETSQKDREKSAKFELGSSPIAFDRKKQLQTIQKSLRQFNNPKVNSISAHFSLDKQYSMNIADKKPTNYEKVVTERAIGSQAEDKGRINTGRAHSSLSSSQNLIKYRQVPTNPEVTNRREYRQYDIIKNTQRLFFA